MTISKDNSRIFVAGHMGMVGSAIVRALKKKGNRDILTRTRQELDLADPAATLRFLEKEKPAAVIIAAARVGGIKANSDFPVEFLLDNLKIQNSLIEASYKTGVKKLLFLGSSCIYPKLAPQPIKEESLLTSELEPTNEAYAIAKITGIKLCQAFRREYGCNFVSAMPTNLYGTGDNYDPETSHVLPAMIGKFHRAKQAGEREVALWGTGNPKREFLHSDDLAQACVLLLEKYNDAAPINVGCGEDVSIRELAELIREIVGFSGAIRWDTSKPDGTPRKLLDISRIKALGWSPRIGLADGVRKTYEEFKALQNR
ncbi:MAG: GDP-L-fucose synthase [Methylacidiphilales bacterium]|nr:GDP-L-fucose synthase [Candidatus Methylacidiphilales bacterium]